MGDGLSQLDLVWRDNRQRIKDLLDGFCLGNSRDFWKIDDHSLNRLPAKRDFYQLAQLEWICSFFRQMIIKDSLDMGDVNGDPGIRGLLELEVGSGLVIHV